MRKIFIIGGLFFLFALLSCAQKSISSLEKKPEAQPIPQELIKATKEGWEDEWKKTVEAARKEVTVAIRAAINSEQRIEVIKRFKEKFGIDAEVTTGRGAELIAKTMVERRAGIYLVDLYTEGPNDILDILKPAGVIEVLDNWLLLPEVKDEKLWNGPLHFDKARMMAGGFESVTTPITININLVRPEEIKSYNDLLNPKWKGKILQGDPTVSGGGSSIAATVLAIMGEDFFKKLLEQQPMVVRDKRLESEWLAQGKYSIGFGMDNKVVGEFIQNGAPFIQIVPKEGAAMTSSGQIVIFKQAPHPNAARVFLNWILSKEGQSFYPRLAGFGSRRNDIANEWLSPDRRPQPEILYIREGEEEYMGPKEQRRQQIEALYRPYLTR